MIENFIHSSSVNVLSPQMLRVEFLVKNEVVCPGDSEVCRYEIVRCGEDRSVSAMELDLDSGSQLGRWFFAYRPSAKYITCCYRTEARGTRHGERWLSPCLCEEDRMGDSRIERVDGRT